MVEARDPAAEFAWKALAHTMTYAAARIPEIADDVVQIDRAMRWGYNWDVGPFEAWDAIGVEASVQRMDAEGIAVPENVKQMLASGRKSFYDGAKSARTYFDMSASAAKPIPTEDKIISLPALKETASNVVASNLGASLIDLGDGVLGLEVHTKMNTIDDDVTNMLAQAVEEAEKNFEALVIGNQGAHFGVGANVLMVFMAAQQQQWDQIDDGINRLQQNLQGLRYAKVPVVAAPFQFTFGGCAEIAMAADACQAAAETYMGLVEVGVGLIPAGGGCLRMVERWTGPAQGADGADLLPFIGAASLQNRHCEGGHRGRRSEAPSLPSADRRHQPPPGLPAPRGQRTGLGPGARRLSTTATAPNSRRGHRRLQDDQHQRLGHDRGRLRQRARR